MRLIEPSVPEYKLNEPAVSILAQSYIMPMVHKPALIAPMMVDSPEISLAAIELLVQVTNENQGCWTQLECTDKRESYEILLAGRRTDIVKSTFDNGTDSYFLYIDTLGSTIKHQEELKDLWDIIEAQSVDETGSPTESFLEHNGHGISTA